MKHKLGRKIRPSLLEGLYRKVVVYHIGAGPIRYWSISHWVTWLWYIANSLRFSSAKKSTKSPCGPQPMAWRMTSRSEERRVGKECRARGERWHGRVSD